MSSMAKHIPLLALAATAGSIAAVYVTLSRPEALIHRSIHSALSQVAPATRKQAAAPAQLTEQQLLRPSSTGTAAEGPLALARSLTVGDRITITGKDGERRTLEVADVRPLVEAGRAAADGTGANFVLVTCNVLGAGPGAVVRFVIEDTPSAPAALPATLHRAL